MTDHTCHFLFCANVEIMLKRSSKRLDLINQHYQFWMQGPL